jgi:site-specific DNA-methyltransferase (adenine-specific)
MGHIAGNSNTNRMRKFPHITEVCVQYVRDAEFTSPNDESMDMQEWVISEWDRSGLTRQDANVACGVADAASRKYLMKGNHWYYHPPNDWRRWRSTRTNTAIPKASRTSLRMARTLSTPRTGHATGPNSISMLG